MPYPFKQIFAVDPERTEMVAGNASVVVFAPGDATRTPLTLTTLNGLPLENPVETNDRGFSKAFMADIPEVAWESGEHSGTMESFTGVLDEAVAAKGAALAAQVAAENAERNTIVPTSDAIASAITTDGPAREAIGAVVTAGTNDLKPDNGGKPVGKGELVVNVRDYGAKGDGQTDDINAIRLAVQALRESGGGTLLFPPGTYTPSGSIELGDYMSVVGYGATITKGFYGLSHRGRGYGAGPRNVSIRGFRFLGSFTGTKRVVGMQWHHARNLTVEDCTFEESIIWGHTFDLQGCDGVTIRNNIWMGFDPSSSPHSEAIQCDVSARAGASLVEADLTRYDGLPTINVLVEHNQFLPLTIASTTFPCPNPIGSHGGVEGTFFDNITFRNNVVKHPTTEREWYPGAVHFIGARGLKIHDNTFEGLPGSSGLAISLNNGRYVIHQSEVRDASPVTHMSDAPLTPRSISIRGNSFVGWTTGTAVIDISGDARGHYANGIDVRENTFRDGIPNSGTAPTPVLIRWAENVNVVGNNYNSVRRVAELGDSRSVHIDSNTLVDGVNNAVYAVRVNGLQITGNEFKRIGLFLNLDQVDGLLVTGNGFEDGLSSAGYGILNAVTAGLVTHNRLRGASTVYGLSWRGATTRSQCRNNIVDATITKGVDVVAPAVVDVGSNI